ncbi:MAG: hypothetical protein ACRDTR_08160 [Rubrobacter sp.]
MTEPSPSFAPENATPGRHRGRTWSVAGIVCGVLPLPGLLVGVTTLLSLGTLGLLGILLGVVGYARGARRLGSAAMAVGGLQLAYLVVNILSFGP